MGYRQIFLGCWTDKIISVILKSEELHRIKGTEAQRYSSLGLCLSYFVPLVLCA
jgi:hypothetical protein